MQYYEINEETARRAHEMMSFREYQEGSATAVYRAAVDEAAALVEKQKQKVSAFYHDKLDALLDRYSRRLAEWTNARNRNGASCPSVMVCGPSNFPTKKKNRQNARDDSLWREYNSEIKPILDKIRTIGTGAIDFADPNAREMLVDRLEELKKKLEDGKAMNAHYRKHKTMKGFPGISDEGAARIDEAISKAYSWAQKPMPDYELSSLRGKIKRAEERLAEFDKRESKSASDGEAEFDGVRLVRNSDENRLQLIFDGKPNDETRALLKSEGFRWSPRNEAWQRQLTDNAERAAQRVLDSIGAAPVPAPEDDAPDADDTPEESEELPQVWPDEFPQYAIPDA